MPRYAFWHNRQTTIVPSLVFVGVAAVGMAAMAVWGPNAGVVPLQELAKNAIATTCTVESIAEVRDCGDDTGATCVDRVVSFTHNGVPQTAELSGSLNCRQNSLEKHEAECERLLDPAYPPASESSGAGGIGIDAGGASWTLNCEYSDEDMSVAYLHGVVEAMASGAVGLAIGIPIAYTVLILVMVFLSCVAVEGCAGRKCCVRCCHVRSIWNPRNVLSNPVFVAPFSPYADSENSRLIGPSTLFRKMPHGAAATAAAAGVAPTGFLNTLQPPFNSDAVHEIVGAGGAAHARHDLDNMAVYHAGGATAADILGLDKDIRPKTYTDERVLWSDTPRMGTLNTVFISALYVAIVGMLALGVWAIYYAFAESEPNPQNLVVACVGGWVIGSVLVSFAFIDAITWSESSTRLLPTQRVRVVLTNKRLIVLIVGRGYTLLKLVSCGLCTGGLRGVTGPDFVKCIEASYEDIARWHDLLKVRATHDDVTGNVHALGSLKSWKDSHSDVGAQCQHLRYQGGSLRTAFTLHRLNGSAAAFALLETHVRDAAAALALGRAEGGGAAGVASDGGPAGASGGHGGAHSTPVKSSSVDSAESAASNKSGGVQMITVTPSVPTAPAPVPNLYDGGASNDPGARGGPWAGHSASGL